MGFFSKIKEGLKKTRENVVGKIDTMLKSFKKIDDELFEELEELLIMGDVGVATASKICEELKDKVKEEKISDPSEIRTLLCTVTADLLRGGQELHIGTKPSVILVIGVNGVGKTTTIGKIANNLVTDGKKVTLAAADTFRAAAIDQLQIWAQRSHADIVKQNEGSDPAAVVYDAISSAKAKGSDVVICDTAGRLHNKKHLMDELSKINRIIDRELPDADKEVLLVLDATTGQNAVNQASEFAKATGITGIVLTKLDGTAKGGVVLAIADGLGIPVKFIGVGEQIDDLQPFDPDSFAKALFENGDNND
ncbi:MAG: signal recognition particle-docking protein FtsY [Eubacteriales bacterium]|nr:signal recognition particle-docking protein FtsY [Eubacteriales bacterium]